MTEKFDIQRTITESIIAAIEAGASGAEYKMPWHNSSGAPINVTSRKRYNGTNVLALWIAAASKGYGSDYWGTYKQWTEKGMQVRKGEKSTPVLFWKPFDRVTTDASGKQVTRKSFFARGSFVFNFAQCDVMDGHKGFVEPAKPVLDGAATMAHVDAYVANLRADIVTGTRACYIPALDKIQMPDRKLWLGSVETATESYYAVLMHELIHWTGAKKRLDRDLSKGRFGDSAYAFEELIAELGAAYACASLGITNEPRKDHARYVQSWLKALQNDHSAIIKAGSYASKAVAYLDSLQPSAAIEAEESEDASIAA